tara:strand:+ start:448 stop:618 length:171 start_codon:yes stop_codon:yes gene_type:complete
MPRVNPRGGGGAGAIFRTTPDPRPPTPHPSTMRNFVPISTREEIARQEAQKKKLRN